MNPRRVEINGHQEYWKGWFHQFTSDGMAIIETDEGFVKLEPVYKIKFLDKEKPWNKTNPS